MKARKIKIEFMSNDEFFKEFSTTWNEAKTRTGRFDPKAKKSDDLVLYFNDLAQFSKIFTTERLRLLQTVRLKKPESLNELARLLERDYPNVFNDAKFLAAQGILTLEAKPGRGRGTVKPIFDWDGFDIAV